jgi:hypothetical protein
MLDMMSAFITVKQKELKLRLRHDLTEEKQPMETEQT